MLTLYTIIGVCLVLGLLFLLPIKGKRYKKGVPVKHIDERDTMFSRNEIKPGDKNYYDYYSIKPDNLILDDKFRAKPGILKEGTTYYNKYAFAAADASFEAVEAFFPYRKEDKSDSSTPSNMSQSTLVKDRPDELSVFLKEWVKKMGAHSVGICEMKDYHFYTVGGRRERYGKPVENNHKYGIALTVEMDYELTMTGPEAPVVMESAREYLNSGMIATQLTLTLRNLGYEATSHIDANYDLVCPLVAKDAGLGEIGRMGLLMTPKLGPRVRIAVVTTDAPLIINEPSHSDSVLDFCTYCKKCAYVCPSAAIPLDERRQHKGGLHWQINQEACFTYWCQAGTDCGKCMAVCPYSHKTNWIHDFVRWGIRNNFFFRRVAVRLDDIIYGKRPKAKKSPDWIE